MDIEALYRDYSIPYQTEGHKHCRPGWVNTACPHCTGEHEGLHLGFNTDSNHFVCWRCGGHYAPDSISKLLNVSLSEAFKIIRRYGAIKGKVKEFTHKIRAKAFKFPDNAKELSKQHRTYLESRNFDPDKLIQDWGILGTGVFSRLDKLDYKHRIIIPFVWDGEVVSFDSRDITNRSQNKYMACPEDRELISHKRILFGRQDKWGDTGICVEGPTDVFRFGFNSFATSGIKYTPAQMRLISKTFKCVPVVFDNDPGNPQSKIQALKLVADLKFRGVDSFRVEIEGDPGGMRQSEADYLVKQLI